MSKNVCQYWVEAEPVQCSYWDEATQLCTFEPIDNDPAPTKYPKCNRIGTAIICSHYTGEGTQARCVLPDTLRQVGQRFTPDGDKWLKEDITQYNDGACDGAGTAANCTGYSPYHMAFSSVQPDQDIHSDVTDFLTVPSGLDYRLPIYYDIVYLRSLLSRCYWWKDSPVEFSIDESTGRINDVPHKCTNTSDEMIQEYWDIHSYDNELGMWKAPCNGCKPECPGYTGVCWQYCIDSKMKQGDKILAEQILELRYYLFRENWTSDKYKGSFVDPDIQAWAGKVYQKLDDVNPNEVRWLIEAWHVYMSDFEYFSTNREKIPLTAGTQANNYDGQYPDLVRELKSLPLKPIIRNRFETFNDINFFESCDLDHNELVIFGETFWYGSQTYAINLSDPDLSFLPKNELLKYSSMFEIEQSWNDTEDKFDEFYDKFSSQMDLIIEYLPDKIKSSELGTDIGMFYIGANTFWGDNDIIVLSKGSGTWEYDHIYFRKVYIGGVITQTSFEITGRGTTDYLPSYQDDFMGHSNDNGEISFKYTPLVSEWRGESPRLAYVYNDAVRTRLDDDPANPSDNTTFVINYKLYKVLFGSELELTIPNGELHPIGSAGYILVKLTDANNILSNAIKDWEIDGNIYLHYADGTAIKMEVYEKSTDRLETNQFFIKPKNPAKFKSVCNDTYLSIDNIYVYEKHSFGETPSSEDYEIERESFVGEEDELIYHEVDELTTIENNYYLTGFNQDTLMISGVIQGLTGKIKGQTKTKMVTWVRQPYCRDVEIYYKWSASYQRYTCLPQYNCYFDREDEPRKKYHKDENGYPISIDHIYTPPCGDHDLSVFSGKGAMWYPYGDCGEYDRYNIVGSLTEWDINIMEVFRSTYMNGSDPHGQFDIRMMGPADNFGRTCETHATLKNCVCDWSFCNDEKIGENRFAGYAKYRGGVIGAAKERALRSNGSTPKFGNVYRDFMRSYRSIDNIDYYYVNDVTGYFSRKYKWVPINEYFSSSDIRFKTTDYKYKTYSSNDYYEDNSYFIHPMGVLLASTTIDGVDVNEELYVDEDDIPIRLRFEDVFITHSSTAGIYHPYPKNPSVKMISGDLVPIIAWYTYKDFPEGTDKSIQWAWKEVWKDIERDSINISLFSEPDQIGDDHPIQYDDSSAGKHDFLDITYPDYEYDYEMKEHRLITDEGSHILKVIPCNYNEEGYILFLLTLDDGPFRIFDIDGEWVTDIPDSIEFNYPAYTTNKEKCENIYAWCIDGDWIEAVTLFDSNIVFEDSQLEYKATAESEDRVIYTYDANGEEVVTYYQRGLYIELDQSKFAYLPSQSVIIPPNLYELKLNKVADDSYNDYTEEESINYYVPATNYLDLKYYCPSVDAGGVEILFNFTGEGEEYKKRILSKVQCIFTIGAEPDEDIPNAFEWKGKLYHEPAIEILVSEDGSAFTSIYNDTSMSVSNKTSGYPQEQQWSYKIPFSLDFVKSPVNFVKLKFRITPTETELSDAGVSNYYIFCENWVHIKFIYLYDLEFIEGVETINTYECRYNISYGSHGDIPPHGYESTGSLLYYNPIDRSTVYQMDSSSGMLGVSNSSGALTSVNKTRGRIMEACHQDKERLTGSIVSKWENEQQKIHDDIAIGDRANSFSMAYIVPPGLVSYLSEKNMEISLHGGCSFVNTYPRPLSSIKKQSMYSPWGHYFKIDMSFIHREYTCGRFGSVFGRLTRDVFEYSFVNAYDDAMSEDENGISGAGTIDAITAYVHGAGMLLINPFLFLMSTVGVGNTGGAGSYESTQDGDVQMTLPYNVYNLY